MNYRDVSSVTATGQPSVIGNQPYGNLHRLSDALTASFALALTVGAVCLLCELPARLVLLAALVPWGLLALARLLALATVLVEEFLAFIGRPRDLNRDGQVGFPVHVDEAGGEPWR